MVSDIQKVNRGLVKSVVIRTRCSMQDMPGIMAESFQKVSAYMASKGALAAGAPYVAYFNQDMNDMQIEIGIPVGMYVRNTDELFLSEIPEGDYLSTIYTGPYSGLKEVYGAMTNFAVENGYEVKGAVYESYLNDPSNTKEEALMTEILFRL